MKRVLWMLFGAVLLLVLWATVQFQRHPPLAPYAALTAPEAAPSPGAVRVRFAGVTTLVFDDGETAWMTDGFFSRPSARDTFTSRIGPDPERIAQGLARLGVTRLAAVVPVHSHYDHAMDSPEVARRTGALLVGSASTLQIGRGAKLPEDRMREVKPGDTLQFGKFSVRFIQGRHSPTPFSDGHSVENIEAPVEPPARATAWREGTVWSLVVTHAGGGRWLVQGSAGYVPGALAGVRADTVFLGTGTLGRKDEAYRAAYWNETVRAVGAKRVVPVHWDNFWRPLDEPLQAMPLLLDDFGVVMADLTERAKANGVAVAMPPLYVAFAP